MEQPNAREVARASLDKARKIHKAILQRVKDLKASLGDAQRSKNVNLTASLEQIENLMKELRLASMAVTFCDFEYAHEKDVEGTLWQAHVSFNGEYRQIVSRVNSQNQVVLKRKVDKLYRDFLKTAQDFYRGYIQRLSAQFWIPELQQAARGLDIQSPQIPQQEQAPPAALRTKLLGSCYLTLVRLGDLARYRCQASDKPPKASFEIALTYYGLAHELDPDDGASHHQTAVLYQPSANHLEIIYYFLRSISVAKPHKLGAGNLERAYKSLLDNQPGSRSNAKNAAARDAFEPLTTWLLKLHAHYYQGAQFSAREELEKEVLHRWQVCLKTEGSEEFALKMLLLNIAACDVAFDKVKDISTWTIEGSRSCNHLLVFKVRVAVVLFRTVKSVLEDEAAKFAGDEQQSDMSTNELSPTLARLLPLTRIYFAWIYASRAYLVRFQEWLEPYVWELHGLLADVLTLLLPLAISNEDLVESKYLLPEDRKALGLRPLLDRKLPLFFDVQIVPGLNPPKCRKSVKLRKEALGLDCGSHTENIWRIRDILCCGIYLAGSGKSPLTITTKGDGAVAWVYPQDGAGENRFDDISVTRMLGRLKISALKAPAMVEDSVEGSAFAPNQAASSAHRGQNVSVSSFQLGPEGRRPDVEPTAASAAWQPKDNGGGALDEEFGADSAMADMVNKLIDDDDEDENTRPRSSKAHIDTTYGLDSSAANDIFANLVPTPGAQKLAASASWAQSNAKALPSLPWNYFYSPAPNDPGTDHTSGHGHDVPRTVQGQLGGSVYGRSPGQDTHPTGPYTPNVGNFPMYGNQQEARTAQGPVVNPGAQRPNPSSPSYSSDQRNSALDNLKSALYAQYGPGASGNVVSPSFGYRQPVSPDQGNSRRSVHGHPSRASISSSSADLRGSRDFGAQNKDAITQGLTSLQLDRGFGSGVNQSPLLGGTNGARGGAQAQASTISPLSTGHGFNRPGSQGLGQDRWNSSPEGSTGLFAQQVAAFPGNDTSLAFSNPGSLWSSTPAITDGPRGTVACNGNFFNATTPFGRSGDVNNRDDPTHFRNKLKELGAGQSLATNYDRAILESAYAENPSTRSRQQ
ncbi:hypothetical protein JX266_000909 [Neoarthrinium moseri]|nr:hypothetical protein JX266_000909 [Neoarthrinium moseri]